MSYTPRIEAPDPEDLRWINTDYGGYNKCILGNPNDRRAPGSVLPNCTGYVHGRWMELGNTNTDYPGLSLQNASTYISNSSYESGTEPRLGAILVFGAWGSNGAGHVAVVEDIIDNGIAIRCSESDYGDPRKNKGTYFHTVIRTRENNWAAGASQEYNHNFLGFLYHPEAGQPDPIYQVRVIGGTADKTFGKTGEKVHIKVSDYIAGSDFFDGWTAQPNTGYFENPELLETNYVIGENDVVLIAAKKKVNSMGIIYYMPAPFTRFNS